MADNTTAGSVTPLTFAFDAGGRGVWLRRVNLRKTQASVTNSSFRLWLLNASPTVTNGDNGVIAGSFLSTVLHEPILIDADVLLTGGGSLGSSLFDEGLLDLPATCYGLLEARAAYTPASAEVFTLELLGVPK